MSTSKFENSFEVLKSIPQSSSQGKLFVVKEIPENGRYKYDPQGRSLMVKVLRLIVTKTADETQELINARREVELMMALKHENIVRYYDHFEETHPSEFQYNDKELVNMDGVFFRFIVMEYCTEGDLTRWAQQKRTPEEIMGIVHQLAVVLCYLHENAILHRDIKSANIFIREGNILKLGDYGLARIKQDINTSRIGTAMYAAPEITVKGFHEYDMKVDVYSAGIVILEHILGVAAQFAKSNWHDTLDTFKRDGIFPPNILATFPDTCILVGMMTESNPARRISSFGVLQWTLGHYFYLNGKTGAKFGSWNQNTSHIKIVNCEYMLEQELLKKMEVKYNQDLFGEKLSLSNLKEVVLEFDNDRDTTAIFVEGMRAFLALKNDVAGLQNLLSFCGPLSGWITKINVTVTNFAQSTKLRLFQVTQSPRRSLSSVFPIPKECVLQNWEDIALNMDTVLSSDEYTSFDFSKLAQLPELKCLTLSGLTNSEIEIKIEGEHCKSLEHMSLSFTSSRSSSPQLILINPLLNIKSLYLGNVDVNFEGVKLTNLTQLAFNDCRIAGLGPSVYGSDLKKVAFFKGSRNQVPGPELVDMFLLSEHMKEVFYDVINFPGPIQPSIFTKLTNYFWKSPKENVKEITESRIQALLYLKISMIPETSPFVIFQRPKDSGIDEWIAKLMNIGESQNLHGRYNGSWNWTWEPVNWSRN